MFGYLISFLLLIVLASLIFEIVKIILNKMPNDIGKNAWFLVALVLAITMIICISKPHFFKIHTAENGLYFEDL